ncbi:MAG: capsular polysaccharide biosynthesis protein [gamma proteobacterium endosymbiont of Lamellibrachia anaximandri]|nr:capsular polysaccharide biosynthesis protein [gamma proteobacterium endosymbiont of Lamellibrachia anaximandri]MBL3534091.1 capsular polysaccharide biosynthesis protein [gamma proteobacterium endosymbiont of Lamellibrachia anaximandri]
MPSTSAVTFSRGIFRIPHLRSFLDVDAISRRWKFFPCPAAKNHNETVIGWGLKTNTAAARRYAESNNLQYLTLEDGFLRSVGLGVDRSPPLSLVIDDLGIYYDATRPSRLEKILTGKFDDIPDSPPFRSLRQYLDGVQNPLENRTLISRAQQCIKQIIDNRLSKYNSSPDITLKPTAKKRILVVDQTAGDLSIEQGLAKPESFTRMLDAALEEHPAAEILVKIHPDVIAGRKQSHLLRAGKHTRVHLISENCNPISLLQQVDHVYAVTSQMGFEALMTGKPVTCFGVPFYAGWGLTDDRIQIPRRTGNRTIEQLFIATYILYSRYRDPDTGKSCEIERVIDHLALQRHYFVENSGSLFCYGFTPWKRGYVRDYLYSPWNNIRFASSAWQIERRLPKKNARIVVWGIRENDKIRELARENNIPIWRMEDGFLRSVGLGSDLTAPASLVLDQQGIYFDPDQISDLETILENTDFSEEKIHRAQSIRRALIDSGISKYNVGERKPLIHSAKPGQRIILVPGQVEGDASIRLGCRDIRTNGTLLQAVRENAPDAYIVYKPHPDVLSGNRKGHRNTRHPPYFDQLVTDISISQCLDTVDEVHTMTSLVGFEGLLRGKRVTTYGLPFYAGWGLTTDKRKLDRNNCRNRTLTVDELIAGCMVLYPRYINGFSRAFSSPEMAISGLESLRSSATNETRISTHGTSRMARKLNNLIHGLMYGK